MGWSWATDGSRRAFYREFARVVESSDVILHVLDARDPLGCRCVDVERYIVKRNPDKKIVLMLNKIGPPSTFPPTAASLIGWSSVRRALSRRLRGA